MHQPKDDIGDDHQIGTRVDDKDKVEHPPKNAPPSFDAGVVSLSADHRHTFAADDGDDSYLDDHHIFGVLGRDKLKDNENSDFEIRLRGSGDGKKEGALGDVHDDDDAYDVNTDCAGGDSGGPHFTREHDPNHRIWEVYISGVHYGGTLGVARATMSDAVESEFNLRF